MLTMLYRYAGAPPVDAAALTAPDANALSWWARDAMAWGLSQGLITGHADGALHPTDFATRAELAVTLTRFLAFGD